MNRKIPSIVAIAAAALAFAGCSAGAPPEPKTYKAESVRVVGTIAYVEARVTKTKIKVTYTCDVTLEKDCAVLQRNSIFKAIVTDGKLTKVDKTS